MSHRNALVIALVAGSVCATTSSAQQYQKAYGLAESREQAQDVTRAFPSRSGLPEGAITVGSHARGESTDCLIARHDPIGSLVWSEVLDFGGERETYYSVWTVFGSSPEPHYIASGVTDAVPGAPIENLVTRFDPGGAPLWTSAVTGTTPEATDLVHVFRRSELATQVVEYVDGSIIVIGNLLGDPLVMRLDPATGAPIFIASYPSPREQEIGITDVRVAGDLILVIGSIEIEAGPTAPNDVGVFAMTLAPDLSIVDTRRYDILFAKEGGQFPYSEWGHALAETETPGAYSISGVTDYGDPEPPFGAGQAAPFTLTIDPATLAPLAWETYDPLLGAIPMGPSPRRWINGYGAQVFDRENSANVLAGTFVSEAGGEVAAAFEVDVFSGSIAWTQRYARSSSGRGVDVAEFTCGELVAGRVDGSLPPLSGSTGTVAEHLVKVNDLGLTECNEDKVDLLNLRAQFNQQQVQLTAVYHDNFINLQPEPITQIDEDVFCESATCIPCPGDLADSTGFGPPDGMIDFGDFFALSFLAGPCPGMIPGCPGDLADTTGFGPPDGMIDFGDFFALSFLAGPCP